MQKIKEKNTYQLQIPSRILKYILFQRTNYLVFPKKKVYKFIKNKIGLDPYKFLVTLESNLFQIQIKEKYSDDINQEFESIKSFIPNHTRSILDIGCGMAGINIPIFRYFQRLEIDFYLLDRTFIEERIYYHFQERGAFYNSLRMAKEFLQENGLPSNKIHLIHAPQDGIIRLGQKIDLLISLISWGWHYPIATYLDSVINLLSPNGRLIVDVRRDTDGIDMLEKKFQNVEVISTNNKGVKICAFNPVIAEKAN